jgi:hypothetical protein
MLHNVVNPGFLLRCVMRTIEHMIGTIGDAIVTTQYKHSLLKNQNYIFVQLMLWDFNFIFAPTKSTFVITILPRTTFLIAHQF